MTFHENYISSPKMLQEGVMCYIWGNLFNVWHQRGQLESYTYFHISFFLINFLGPCWLPILFFKAYFDVDYFFKVFIEFVTILLLFYVLGFFL